MAIVLAALFAIVLHDLSERNGRKINAASEISNPFPSKLPISKKPVISKIGLAAGIKAQKISTEVRAPKPAVLETLLVYLQEEKRQGSIPDRGPSNSGEVPLENSTERLEEFIRLSSSGSGHEAMGTDRESSRDDKEFDRDSDRHDRDDDHDRHSSHEEKDDHEKFEKPDRHD
jgi:hypothetical protein